jgi:DNA adenine methylase
MNINNKSPLRYPGGKTRACKILDQILTTHYTITSSTIVISPFFGGGSFEFYLQNKYNTRLIVNDKFRPLSNFWIQTKNNNVQLCSILNDKIDTSKEDFIKYRKDILTLEDDIMQAVYYFIINRCSFSGATLSGGFSEEASKKRFTKSSIDRVEQLNLSNVVIYQLDFIDFLRSHVCDKDTNDFIGFIDPPYYLEKKSKLYGTNGDLHETFNHNGLYELLTNELDGKFNWIMTYNNCEYIRDLYKKYIIIDASWSYGMNKSKTSSEIIILSRKVPTSPIILEDT